MTTCIKYALSPDSCPCHIILQNGSQETPINLSGATVRNIGNNGDFHIQGLTSGARVSSSSDFTIEEIRDFICECNEFSGGGEVGEVSSATTLACDDQGNLIYLDLSVIPPVAYNMDGSEYIGAIVKCDDEVHKWSEKEFCSSAGIHTRILCWKPSDPTGTSTTSWILSLIHI